MISRRTALAIAEAYESRFTRPAAGIHSQQHSPVWEVQYSELYDFLYANEYSSWFCNSAKRLRGRWAVREWVMQLHTGETKADATPNWSWESQRQLGQRYLEDLSQDIIQTLYKDNIYTKKIYEEEVKRVISNLEDDGRAAACPLRLPTGPPHHSAPPCARKTGFQLVCNPQGSDLARAL